MTTCIIPKELRSNQAPGVYPRVSQHHPGEAALICQPVALQILEVPVVAIFVQWSLSPNCQLLWAVKPLLGGWGHVWWLVILPRVLVLHLGIQSLLQGLGRLWSPSLLWPPTWTHLIGCPSPWEAQDTCTGFGQHHRVLLEELLTIWHTNGGLRPVWPFHPTSPHRYP